MSKHTPEPWSLDEFYMEYAGGSSVPIISPWIQDYFGRGDRRHEEAAANMARIVACVNACAGINPEAVPELIRAVDAFLQSGGDPLNTRVQEMREAIALARS